MVSMDRNRKTPDLGPAAAHATVMPDITMEDSGRPGQPGGRTAYTAKS